VRLLEINIGTVAYRAMWGYRGRSPADINPHETGWGRCLGQKWNAWLRNDGGTARAGSPAPPSRVSGRAAPGAPCQTRALPAGITDRDGGFCQARGTANVNFVHRVYTFAAHGPNVRTMVV
jgi:hypothetical protein